MIDLGTWELVSARFGGTVTGLAASSSFAVDRTVFAASMGGLHRSRDAGLTWQPLGAALPGPFLTAVAVSPDFAEDGVLLAASLEGGVFRSADAGTGWAQADFHGRPVNVAALEFSPDFRRDGMAFAATLADGIFRSTDRGASWESASFGLLDLNVQDVIASPAFAEDQTAYASTTSGVYFSPNGGRAWRELPFPAEAGSVQCLAAVGGEQLFAGTERAGAYHSADRGRTWRSLADGLGAAGVNCLATAGRTGEDGGLLAATDSGIYLSRDAGRRWQRCSDLSGALCLAWALDEAGRGTAVVGLPQAGVYRSVDGLTEWAPANEGLSGRAFAGIALSPHFAVDRTMYVYGPGESVLRSADAGLSWTEAGLPARQINDLALVTASNRQVDAYAAAASGLWISRQAAQDWEQLTDLPVQRVRLSPAPAEPAMLVAGVRGRGLWLSRDAGRDWEQLEAPWELPECRALALSPAFEDDQQAFVAVGEPQAGRVEIWQGGIGARWRRVVRYKGVARAAALAVAHSYPQDGRWYASIGPRLFRTDAVRAGRRSRKPRSRTRQHQVAEGQATVFDLAALDGPGAELLLAATDGGAYASENGGEAWRRIENGLPARPLVAIAPATDAKQRTVVYALELGGHLWRAVGVN